MSAVVLSTTVRSRCSEARSAFCAWRALGDVMADAERPGAAVRRRDGERSPLDQPVVPRRRAPSAFVRWAGRFAAAKPPGDVFPVVGRYERLDERHAEDVFPPVACQRFACRVEQHNPAASVRPVTSIGAPSMTVFSRSSVRRPRTMARITRRAPPDPTGSISIGIRAAVEAAHAVLRFRERGRDRTTRTFSVSGFALIWRRQIEAAAVRQHDVNQYRRPAPFDDGRVRIAQARRLDDAEARGLSRWRRRCRFSSRSSMCRAVGRWTCGAMACV